MTDLISILNDWLMDHLNSEDKKLIEYLNCKGPIWYGATKAKIYS